MFTRAHPVVKGSISSVIRGLGAFVPLNNRIPDSIIARRGRGGGVCVWEGLLEAGQ